MSVPVQELTPGTEIVSDWMTVTQERIGQFAEATGDRQWIHVDPERARAESPYGVPVAHGFLTLSLLPRMLRESLRVEGASVNYGLNRVRFTAPVPAGSRVRGTFTVASVERGTAGTKVTWAVKVECEGAAGPCLVAEWVTLYAG